MNMIGIVPEKVEAAVIANLIARKCIHPEYRDFQVDAGSGYGKELASELRKEGFKDDRESSQSTKGAAFEVSLIRPADRLQVYIVSHNYMGAFTTVEITGAK